MTTSAAVADVYLYGMTVVSTLHRVATTLSAAGGYVEITESRSCPGGETMNAAMLLSGLGVTCAVGGPHWGRDTREILERYTARYGIDARGVTRDDAFAGLCDYVVVHGSERTVFGRFGQYFAERPRRWDEADAHAIEHAQVVAIDPFFADSSERAAARAVRVAKPYVTIDCDYDSALHANAAVTVVSREFRRRRYVAAPDFELFGAYAARASGLTVFTSGPEPILFGRKYQSARSFRPFSVPVSSTLGAGDTFRAGMVFGVLRGLDDAACIRFAAGLAALLCTRFPIADNAPSLAEVEQFLANPELGPLASAAS